MLFVDGYSSHLTQPLSAFCAEHEIELVVLHPNSTHIIQPMDVSLFKSLKIAWKQTICGYQIKFNQLSIQYEDFGMELKETLAKMDVAIVLFCKMVSEFVVFILLICMQLIFPNSLKEEILYLHQHL